MKIEQLHAITKLLLFMLVIPLICVIKLFSSVGLTTLIFLSAILILIIILTFLSDVSFYYVWNSLKFYLITIFFLILCLFAIIDINLHPTKGLQVYLCLIDIILAGFLFVSTSNPSDITLLLMQYEKLRFIALPLLSAIRVMYILNSELQDLRDVQKQRGATLSFNPLKIKSTFKGLSSLIIPALLTTLSVSDRIARTLIVRGYSSKRRITKPPFLKLKVKDYFFILFSIFILIFGIIV